MQSVDAVSNLQNFILGYPKFCVVVLAFYNVTLMHFSGFLQDHLFLGTIQYQTVLHSSPESFLNITVLHISCC